MTVDLRLGDCLDVMATLPADSVDAVVTDPPAGIGFMGRDWDHHRGGRDAWVAWLGERLAAAYRVAKPGAVMLCWAIPRTSHWTALAIEAGGWQIEDRIAHLFATGFPKHKSKLKPAVEDWWLARKPGPKWLGVDAGRIPAGDGVPKFIQRSDPAVNCYRSGLGGSNRTGEMDTVTGRWPPNVALSHHPDCNGSCHPDCPVALLDAQAGERTSGKPGANGHKRSASLNDTAAGWGMRHDADAGSLYGDTGGASRFYFVAKASRADRGDGNAHPTVKATALMQWLCRLACPPGGTILDPFAGSGSTGKAAVREGFGFLGIEADPEYHATAERRIAAERQRHPLLEPVG